MTDEQSNSLEYLIEKAKQITMSDQQVSEQRKSFAYGNSHFENPLITRKMIEEEAEKLGY